MSGKEEFLNLDSSRERCVDLLGVYWYQVCYWDAAFRVHTEASEAGEVWLIISPTRIPVALPGSATSLTSASPSCLWNLMSRSFSIKYPLNCD